MVIIFVFHILKMKFQLNHNSNLIPVWGCNTYYGLYMHCTALHCIRLFKEKRNIHRFLVFSYTIYYYNIYFNILLCVSKVCSVLLKYIIHNARLIARTHSYCLLYSTSSRGKYFVFCFVFFCFLFSVFCFSFFEGWVHCHIVCPMSDCMFLITMNRAVSHQERQWAANNVYFVFCIFDYWKYLNYIIWI